MFRKLFFNIILLCNPFVTIYAASNYSSQQKLIPVDPINCPNLYQWSDVCNVYALIEGQSALLIDLGNGSIVQHLQQAGINIEWVLFTHHHREQCQGYPLLKKGQTKIAAPEAERAFFEKPNNFLKMQSSLSDPYTVYGSSYIRPPIDSIPIDRGFSKMDYFSWRGMEIRCIETRGNSPGGMSYFINNGKGWIAFTGDIIMKGGLMHTWFDSEWDYGYASGLYALHNSIAVVEDFNPLLVLPSHGEVIKDAKHSLAAYREKLKNIINLTLRGYDMPYASSFQNNFSVPTHVPDIWQVTPHVFVFKGPDFSPNFALILSDNGKALAIDCGLLDKKFLVSRLELMQERLGLKTIEAVIITHMHGDHALQVHVLNEMYGTRVWTTGDIAKTLEYPEKYNYAAMINTYDKNLRSLKTDRILQNGERLLWEGFDLTVDRMPGQTEFALCVHGTIDGKKIAFTGDNIFGDPTNSRHNGHEAVVARNSATLEDGYIVASEYLKKMDPDILIGGHSFVMGNPRQMIQRYNQWAYEIRDALQGLSFLEDYRYWFDPFWVQFESYRYTLKKGNHLKTNIIINNFGQKKKEYLIRIHTPKGINVYPDIIETFVEANSKIAIPVEYTVTGEAATGIQRQTLDITLDDIALGEWFDGILSIENEKKVHDVYGNTWSFEILKQLGYFPEGDWSDIVSDKFGFLWLEGKSGLIRFNPRKPESGWMPFEINSENPGEAPELDPVDAVWQSLAPMPYASHDVFGAEIDGKIYIPGGAAPHGLPAVMTNFDRMLIYDTHNDSWAITSPMSVNRRYCNVGQLDGKIWVIGGYIKTDGIENATNTVEIYDPKTDSWTSAPNLHKPCSESVAGVINNRLYVTYSYNNKKEIYMQSIAAGEPEWRMEPAPPYPVFQTDGCVYDNKLYVMIPAVGLIMYDYVSGVWKTDFPPFPGSPAPRASAVVSYRGQIWVISGTDVDDERRVLTYFPVEKRWEEQSPFPQSTLWASGLEVNGKLYVFGGATYSERHKFFTFWNTIRRLTI